MGWSGGSAVVELLSLYELDISLMCDIRWVGTLWVLVFLSVGLMTWNCWGGIREDKLTGKPGIYGLFHLHKGIQGLCVDS